MNARTVTITAIILGAAACAPLEPVVQQQQQRPAAQPAPVIHARSSEAELLTVYFDGTRAHSKDEYKAELGSLQRRLAATPTAFLRTQLALLLSAPHAEPRDLGQALKLLEEVARDAQASGSVKNFAGMLQSYVAEGVRQDENVQSLSQRVKEERRRADQAQLKQDGSMLALEQKLKDEQKKSEAMLTKQEESIQQLTAKLREEQKRAEELQQKLDAIMRIEKSLIERQQVQDAAKEVPKGSTKDVTQDAAKDAIKETPKEPVKEPK